MSLPFSNELVEICVLPVMVSKSAAMSDPDEPDIPTRWLQKSLHIGGDLITKTTDPFTGGVVDARLSGSGLKQNRFCQTEAGPELRQVGFGFRLVYEKARQMHARTKKEVKSDSWLGFTPSRLGIG